MSSARRWAAALVAMALAIGLAGCWGTSGGTESGGTANLDKGPLTFWVMGDSGERFQQLVAPFTKQTGIEVRAVAVPWSAIDRKFAKAVASGQGPDLLQV